MSFSECLGSPREVQLSFLYEAAKDRVLKAPSGSGSILTLKHITIITILLLLLIVILVIIIIIIAKLL